MPLNFKFFYIKIQNTILVHNQESGFCGANATPLISLILMELLKTIKIGKSKPLVLMYSYFKEGSLTLFQSEEIFLDMFEDEYREASKPYLTR